MHMRNKSTFYITRTIYFLWTLFSALMVGLSPAYVIFLIIYIITIISTYQYFFKEGFDKKAFSVTMNIITILLSFLLAWVSITKMIYLSREPTAQIIVFIISVLPVSLIGLKAIINCIDIIRD